MYKVDKRKQVVIVEGNAADVIKEWKWKIEALIRVRIWLWFLNPGLNQVIKQLRRQKLKQNAEVLNRI